MSLDAWKAKAVTEVTLPSGTVAGIALPDTTECIVAGDIPMPIISAMESATEVHEPTNEEMSAMLRYRRALICAAVRTVDGEAVTLTDDDVRAIPVGDADTIYSYATRSQPLPNPEG